MDTALFAKITPQKTSKEYWIVDIFNLTNICHTKSIKVLNLHVSCFRCWRFPSNLDLEINEKSWCWYWDPLSEKRSFWGKSRHTCTQCKQRLTNKTGQTHQNSAKQIVWKIFLDPTSHLGHDLTQYKWGTPYFHTTYSLTKIRFLIFNLGYFKYTISVLHNMT